MSVHLPSTVAELKAARRRMGLSQRELAEHAGTTQSAIARLESGDSDPRLSTVRRIAEVLGVRVTLRRSGTPEASLTRTAAEIGECVARGDANESLRHVVQFLDDLGHMGSSAQRAAVRDEPEPTGDERWDALLAGIAEYVSRRYGFRVPGWTAAPSRFLPRFWFVADDIIDRPAPGLAALTFVSSPPELANRGVFLDRESLVSV